MKDLLATYSKQLEVAFLLGLIVAIDYLKIQDPDLKYVLMGLVASLAGFRGGAAAFGGLKSLVVGSTDKPTQPPQS